MSVGPLGRHLPRGPWHRISSATRLRSSPTSLRGRLSALVQPNVPDVPIRSGARPSGSHRPPSASEDWTARASARSR